MAISNSFDGVNSRINSSYYGGYYQQGRSYEMQKKSDVARVYQQEIDSTGKVSWCGRSCVRCERHTICSQGPLLTKLEADQSILLHSGTIMFEAEVRDYSRLRTTPFLYNDCPSRSLKNYQENLLQTTGMYVDMSTISRKRHELLCHSFLAALVSGFLGWVDQRIIIIRRGISVRRFAHLGLNPVPILF
jgi:hypothetical protein